MSDWVNRFALTGRTALITGASSGIGYAIAEVFADAGADIIAQGRSTAKLEELRLKLESTGCRFTAITGDLSNPETVETISARALEAHPQIDILVNSAGVALLDSVVEYDIKDWQTTLAVNLTAPFVFAKAVLPGMMERKMGKIISISSQAGVIALKNHVAYSASKGGLNALTKALMVEAAPHNIQVNAICPTVVLTKMGRVNWEAPEKREPFLAKTPLGRFGEPVEIADMALYLASPASNLVNGEILMIEGGYSSV